MAFLGHLGVSRLKLAVMVPFVAFVAVLAGSVFLIELQKFHREGSRVSLELRAAIDRSFRGAVASETAELRAVAQAVAANDGFKAAFRRRDRDELLRQTQPLFAEFLRGANITHLYFIDPTRQVFLRAHQPARFGDIVGRATAVGAARARAPVAGIEMGPLGTLTLRVVVPWLDNGEVIGYVEAGKEIDHLFDALRQQFNLHPLVFMPKSRLNRADWEAGMAMLGRQARWDEFADYVLTVRDGVDPAVMQPLLDRDDAELKLGDTWYSWLRLDVPDLGGGRNAVVGMLLDVSARHHDIERFTVMLAAVAIGGALLVIVLFWLVMARVEAELQRVRRRNELLLSSAGEGIIGVDAAGCCAFVNPVARDLLGFASRQMMIGQDMHQLTGHTHGDGRPCTGRDCAVHQTLADGVRRRVDRESYRRVDGTLFPVEYTVTAMVEDDEQAGVVVVFRDITERRQAETALAEAVAHAETQASEVTRINAELEQFAYVASHDLRQPLRMVSSYLGLIARQLGPALEGDLKVCFDYAMGGAQRMDRLILDLLEYSRTGRSNGPPVPVPLAEVVAEALVNLKAASDDADAEVEVVERLPVVQGNRGELVRLFQNLIGNAIKYRASDRRLQISIGCRYGDAEAVVWVRDNGMGMAPDNHERAFQIFQRLVRNDQVEGAGIGLAICKKIVGNCGGRIWIDSAEGQGCCFYVAFPQGTEKGR